MNPTFFIAFAVLATTSVLAACSVPLTRTSVRLLTVPLLAYLQIVVTGRVLGWVGLLGHPSAWLVFELLLLGVAVATWRVRGRPPLIAGCTRDYFAAVFGAGPARTVLIVGVAFTCALYTLLLVAAVLIPQNIDDVLTAYLARAGYWIHAGDLAPFEASAYNSVQTSYPVNAQLPTVRSIVLAGSDRFVGLEPWFAAIVCGGSVATLARMSGSARQPAVLAGVFFMLIPTVVVQAGVALTDLLSVALMLLTITFGLDGWRTRSTASKSLASISFGLAIGTKQTIAFLLPGLAIVVLLMGMLDRRRRGEWAKWLLASSPVVLLLGGIDYLRNWRFFGHPLGDPDSFELFAESARPDERIGAMFQNMRQAAVDNLAMDIPPRLAQRLPLLDRLSVWEPKVGTNYYLEVGQAWLGPLLTISIAAGTMLGLVAIVRSRRWQLLWIPFLAYSYLFTLFWIRPNFRGSFSRYTLISWALLLVLSAIGYSFVARRKRSQDTSSVLVDVSALGYSLVVRRKRSQDTSSVLVGVAALILLGVSLQAFYSATEVGTRPLLGPETAWSANQLTLIERIGGFSDRENLVGSLRYFDTCFAEVDRVAIMLPNKFPQAPLFGTDYGREVIQAVAPFPRLVDQAVLDDLDVGVVFIDSSIEPSVVVDEELFVKRYGEIAIAAAEPPTTPTCVS
jgi:hypothetical protein